MIVRFWNSRINWGLDNMELYPVSEGLESFILEQLQEAKEDW